MGSIHDGDSEEEDDDNDEDDHKLWSSPKKITGFSSPNYQ